MSILNMFKTKHSVFNEGVLNTIENDDLINTYASNSPFPHVVIDNLFNNFILEEVLSSWPNTDDADYEFHNDGTYVRNKKGASYKTKNSESVQRIIDELARPFFLLKLEKLTGINGLIPDPYHFGGGIHETGYGGTLAIHADYNKHFKYKLDRRLNLIVYLNKNWTEKNGGCLELWDENMFQKVREILPVFNRTVVFTTNSTSFHGHPVPVSGNTNIKRRSIALYYFSNGRPEEPGCHEEHSTLWAPLTKNE